MKSLRGFTIGLVLGLSLAFAAVSFAQNSGTPANKTNESCCTMPSCCCKGDACEMKEGSCTMKDGACDMKEGACDMKDGSCCKGNKAADKKDGCCGGDSCKMKGMKHQQDHGQ